MLFDLYNGIPRCYLTYEMLFPDAGLSTRTPNMGGTILQIPLTSIAMVG
jgi:hypothetical protein